MQSIFLALYIQVTKHALGLKKIFKFKQWLAAGGNYGRLTPAHEGAALGHCLNLNIFFKPRNKKVGKVYSLNGVNFEVLEIIFCQTFPFFCLKEIWQLLIIQNVNYTDKCCSNFEFSGWLKPILWKLGVNKWFFLLLSFAFLLGNNDTGMGCHIDIL